MRRDFVSTVQAFIARASVSPSAMRGRGGRGTIDCTRRFLSELSLKPFGVSNAQLFGERLDEATDELLSLMPRRGRKWGKARKILNIFLRNALYSTHLSERFGLARAESVLELPLDSFTGGRLSQRYPAIGPWPGVARLEPAVSARFQRTALLEAKRLRVARVHLDAYWWGVRETGDD